jgi:uncharacterized protein YjaZ
MECPNCNSFMQGLSMSGDDTHITHEFHCNHCFTYVMYSYNPKVTDKIIIEDHPEKYIETDLPY